MKRCVDILDTGCKAGQEDEWIESRNVRFCDPFHTQWVVSADSVGVGVAGSQSKQ